MRGPELLSPLLSLSRGAPVGFRSDLVSIQERPFLQKWAIRGRSGDPSFAERFAAALGITPPSAGRSIESSDFTIISVGPSEWLAVRAAADANGSVSSPAKSHLFAAGLIVVDVSSATTVLRISGSRCIATLRRLCALPLHQLARGDAARTRIGRLAVLVHALEQKQFDLFVTRSYARSLFDQLCDAAELQQ